MKIKKSKKDVWETGMQFYCKKGWLLILGILIFGSTLPVMAQNPLQDQHISAYKPLADIIERYTSNPATGYESDLKTIGDPRDGSANIYISQAFRSKVKSITFQTYNIDEKYRYTTIVNAHDGVVNIPRLRENIYEVTTVTMQDGSVISGQYIFNVYTASYYQIPMGPDLSKYTKNMEGDHTDLFKRHYATFTSKLAKMRAADKNVGVGEVINALVSPSNVPLNSPLINNSTPAVNGPSSIVSSGSGPQANLTNCNEAYDWYLVSPNVLIIGSGLYRAVFRNDCGCEAYFVCIGHNGTNGQDNHYVRVSGNLAYGSLILTPVNGNGQQEQSSSYWGSQNCPDPCTMPTITTNPGNASVCAGNGSAFFTATATGTGPLSYQWQFSNDGGANWGTVTNGTYPDNTNTGSTTTTYTVSNAISSVNGRLYRLAVSNSCGTAYSQAASLTVRTAPTVSASTPAPICPGNSVVLNATGTPAGGTYSWSPSGKTTQSITETPSVATAYTVTYTLNGCSSTANTTVSINTPLTLTVNTPSAVCSGNNVTISATPNLAGGTYLWSPSGKTTASITETPPTGNTIYSVTYTLGVCTGTGSTTVTVNAQPTVSLNAPGAICGGSSAVLTATPSVTGGTYLWTPSAGLSCTACQSPTAAPTATTSYTVTYTLNGCTNTAAATVTVNPKPTVTVNTPAAICTGGTGTILTATPGTAGGTYLWTPSAGLSCTACQSPVANPGATTAYTVTYTLNGCTNSATATATVNQTPTVSINTPAPVCLGSTVILTATPGAGGGTYLWTPSNKTTQSITETPAATTAYSVLYSLNGCTATDTRTVTSTSFTATANATAIGCAAGSATATVSVAMTPATGPFTYAWTGPNGFTATTASFTTTTTGSYNVTVTNTATGCTAQGSATVTSAVNNPVALLTGNNPVCTNAPVTVTASVVAGTGVAPFTYEFSNNTGTILQAAGPTPTLTIVPAGISSIVVKITGANSCAAIQSIPVNSPGPTLSITNLVTLCAGQGTILRADNGGIAGYTYLWKDSTSTNPVRPVLPPADTSRYTIFRTSPQGCKDTATAVTVTFAKPVIQNVVISQPSCALPDGTIMVTASGNPAQLRYRLNSGTWQSAGTFTGLAAGSYTVTVGNANGLCNDTTTPPLTLTAVSTIASGINGPTARCAAEDVQFQAQPPVTGATYQWSATGSPLITPTGSNGPAGTTGSTLIANWAAALSGTTQTVTLVVSKGGCTQTYHQEITITGAIRSNAGPDKGMCPASQVTIGTVPNFSDTGTTPFATYNWTPSTYILNGATSAQAVVNPPVTTVYTLTVTDPVNGCTKTDQVTVTVSVAYNPVADAGTDAVLAITGTPNTAQLGGPGTTLQGAEPNTSIEYLWTAISPAPITALSNVGTATPLFTRPAGVSAATVYKYVLMVQKQYVAPSINKGVTCPVFDTVEISFATATASMCVSPKAYLQGPLTQDGQAGNNGSPLMRNDLAQYGLVPLKDPYSAGSGQVTIDFSGSSIPAKTTTAAVLARSGNTAIVDWVLVQLRDATSGNILGTVPALMQSNGFIVDASGSGSVCFSGLPATATVRLSVLHRNHLGIASTQTFKVVNYSSAVLSYDFTTGLSKAYNNGAGTQMTFKNGSWAMWGANESGDGFVDAQDKGPIYDDAAGGDLFLIYKESDVNMDGFFDGLDQTLWFENNNLSPYSGLLGL